mgnify:CR=1 FL=1
MSSIANTPKPPYYAVIFSSVRSNGSSQQQGDYEKMAVIVGILILQCALVRWNGITSCSYFIHDIFTFKNLKAVNCIHPLNINRLSIHGCAPSFAKRINRL